MDLSNSTWPPNYLNVDLPSTSDGRYFRIASAYIKSQDDLYEISITQPAIIDTQSWGSINAHSKGQFVNKNATVSVVIDALTVTGVNTKFTDWFRPNDVISIFSGSARVVRLVSSIESDTSLTINYPANTTINITSQFYRGISSTTLPPNTKFYFYALGHPTKPGYILSTKSVENEDVLFDMPPGGYTVGMSRQLPYFLQTDSSGDLDSNVYPLFMRDTSAGVTLPFATAAQIIQGTSHTTVVSPASLASAIFGFSNLQTVIGIYASDAEVKDRNVIDKAITPSNLATIFSRPGPIGNAFSDIGTFTDLTANSLSGPAIATPNDLIQGNESKIVTVGGLTSGFKSATSLGNANTVGTFGQISASTITGAAIASKPSDIGKLVTTGVLQKAFANPTTSIGSETAVNAFFKSVSATNLIGTLGSAQNPSPAYISSLTAQSISGPFLASAADAISGSSPSLLLTPGILPSLFSNPPQIGSSTPNSATFTQLTANGVYGPMVANNQTVGDSTVTNQVITPATLATYFSSPNVVLGNRTPAVGRFSSLTADTITVTRIITPPSGLAFGYFVMAIPFPKDINFRYWIVSYLQARNDANTYDIIMNNSIQIDSLSNGLNGHCQSGTLPGYVTVTSGSNVVVGTNTSFTTSFQSGDTIVAAGSSQKIVSIQSDTQLVVFNNYAQSTASYYNRNGVSLSSTLAPNTTYYLYAIGDVSLPAGYLLSPRNVIGGDVLVDLPSGYSVGFSRQTPYTFLTGPNGLISGLPVPSAVKDTSVGVFLAPANQSEVRAQKTQTKGLTPGNIPDIMGSPGTIGNVVSSAATFTDLTASSINGNVIALNQDVLGRKLNTKVLTPAVVSYMFANPPSIGTGTASDATFTTITGGQVKGSMVATATDIKAMISNAKILTPSSIPTILGSPGNIGYTTRGNAKFSTADITTLSSNNLTIVNGGVFNCLTDAQITGAVYANVMNASSFLGTLGNTSSRSNAIVQNLDAQTVSGPFVANTVEAQALINAGKVITPATLGSVFANPPTIGSGTPGNARFSTLRASTLILDYPVAQSNIQFPTMFCITTQPTSTNNSNTSFYIRYTYARNNNDSVDIRVTAPKTVSFSTVGINGPCVSTRSGTITIFANTNVVSGDNSSTNFTLDFIVGGVIGIGGNAYKITDILASDQMIIYPPVSVDFRGVTYTRGSNAIAPNATYYFYAITSPTNPGYLLTTRSVISGQTLVDIPSGYEASNSRQLPFGIVTDNNGNIPNSPQPMGLLDTSVGTPPVFSTSTDITDQTSQIKVISPSNIPVMMGSPGPIGSTSASSGSFTSLTANSISGGIIATSSDVIKQSSASLVLTPSNIPAMMASPGPIGSTTANSAIFSTIQGTSTTNATSTQTGAIITAGGIGVAADAYIGGSLNVNKNTTIGGSLGVTSYATIGGVLTTSGALTVNDAISVSGNATIGGNVVVSGSLNVSQGFGLSGNTSFSGNTYFTNTTDSTSTTTGSIVVTGGVGIQKSMTLGGSLVASGQTSVLNSTNSTSSTSGALTVSGGVGIVKDITVGGLATVSGSISSGSITANGNSTVTGNLGISNQLSVGDQASFSKTVSISGVLSAGSSVNSTNTTTGSLTVSGGIGVVKDVMIGGNVSSKGLSTTSDANVGGSLTVTSAMKAATLTVTGDAGISGTLTAGSASVTSGLSVGGASTVTGALSVGGSSTITDALSVGGASTLSSTLAVGGATTLTGAVTAKSTLKAGDTTVNTLSISSNGASALNVVGTGTIGSDLYVDGDVHGSKDVYVTGKIIANGPPAGALGASKGFSVGGDAGIGGSLYVLQDATVSGALTVAGNTTFSGSMSTPSVLKINDTTASTNTTSGALIVAGGIGTKGGINVGDASTFSNSVSITSNFATTSSKTGALTVSGGIGAIGNVNIGSSNPSSSTTTGALVVSGGAGIGGSIYVGGNMNVANAMTGSSLTLSSTTASTNSTTGALIVDGGIGTSGSLNIGGKVSTGDILSVSSTKASTSTITGAITAVGGIGIGGDAYIGGSVTTSGSLTVGGPMNASGGLTCSSSTITGSLDVSGKVTSGSLMTGPINASTATLTGSLSAPSATLSGNLSTNTLSVSGNSALTGSLSAGGLTVSGNSSLTGSLSTSGLTVNGNSTLTGALSVGSTLGVSSTLTVSGSSSLATVSAGAITATSLSLTSLSSGSVGVSGTTESTSTTTGSLTVAGGLGIGKNTTIGGNANITGNMTAASGTVSGAVSIGGALTTGSLLSSGNAHVSTATVDGSLITGSLQSGVTTVTGALTASGGITTSSITTSGVISSSSSTNSTNTTSGALTVSGGVGIGKSLNVGDYSTFASGVTVSGNLVASSDVNVGGSLTLGSSLTSGLLYADSSKVTIGSGASQIQMSNGTISSSSVLTLASQNNDILVGGLDISGSSAVTLTSASSMTLSPATGSVIITSKSTTTSTGTGALQIAGGIGCGGSVYTGGDLSVSGAFQVNSGNDSTSTSSGAGVVIGGLGIGKRLNVGGNVLISSTTASSSVNSGSLVTGGGAGIGGSLYVGGNVNTSGNLTVAGISSSLPITVSNSNPQPGQKTMTITGDGSVTGDMYVSGKMIGSSDLSVSGDSIFSGGLSCSSSTDSTSTGSGALSVTGGAGIGKSLFVGGPSILKSVHVLSTTESTNSTTGALVVDGGVGISKSLTVGGDIMVVGELKLSSTNASALSLVGGAVVSGDLQVDEIVVNNSTDSTSYSSGSLVTSGGVGIGGKLNVAGITKIYSAQDATSTNNAAFMVTGGIGTGGALITGGAITTNSTTNATSSTTGALIVKGGVGITKDLYIGGNTTVTGTLNSSGPVTMSNSNLQPGQKTLSVTGDGSVSGDLYITGDVIGSGALDIVGESHLTGSVFISSSTESTSTTVGSLVTSGGLGVGKSAMIGGNVSILSSTNSTDSGTGALVVSGGVGIKKDLTVGGDLHVIGNLNLSNPGATSLSLDGGADVIGVITADEFIARNKTSATSSTTGAIQVAGGIGVQGNIVVGSAATVQGSLTVSKAVNVSGLFQASSMTVSGAAAFQDSVSLSSTSSTSLQLSGGAKISGDLVALGNISCSNISITGDFSAGVFSVTDTETSLSSGAVIIPDIPSLSNYLEIEGGVSGQSVMLVSKGKDTSVNLDFQSKGSGSITLDSGKSDYLSVSGGSGSTSLSATGSSSTINMNLVPKSGQVNVQASTDATSSTTGGLHVSGGFSSGKNIFAGGKITSSDTGSFANGSLIVNAGSSSLVVAGPTLGVSGSGSDISISLTPKGNGNVGIVGSVDSSSTTSGTLVVTGGVGVSGSSYVGGSLSVGGDILLPNTYADGSVLLSSSGKVSKLSIGTSGYILTSDGSKPTWTAPANQNSTTYLITTNTSGIGLKSNSTDNSTSTTTGSIVTSGGLGVAKSVVVGDSLSVGSTTSSTNTLTGSLVVSGGVGMAGSLNVGGSLSGSSLSVSSSTVSGSLTTGSLVVSSSGVITGGATVGGDLLVQGSLSTNTNVSVSGKIVSTYSSGNAFESAGDIKVGGSSYILQDIIGSGQLTVAGNSSLTGSVHISGTAKATDATSTTTGSLVLDGGVGIGKSLFVGSSATVGGSLFVTSSGNSTSSTSGCVVLSGGLGVAKNVNAGGTLSVTGLATLSGGASVGGSVSISDSTSSTSSSTGALTVVGGVGVGGSLNVGSSITGSNIVASGTNSLTMSPSTTGNPVNITASGSDTDVGITFTPKGNGDVTLGSGLKVNASTLSAIGISSSVGITLAPKGTANVSVSSTVDSTNSTTGALVVSGGVGISKNLSVGGSVSLGTPLGISSGGTGLTTLTAGDLLYASGSTTLSKLPIGTSGYVLSATVSGPTWVAPPSTTSTTQFTITNSTGTTLSVQSTTDSTSSTSGSAVFSGGVGIGRSLTVGSITASTSTTTGALVVSGGVGVAGDIVSGGSATFANALSATSGGTGSKTYTTGDILYASATNTLSKLSIGSSGQVLTVSGGVPAWSAASGGSSSTTGTTLALSGSTDSTSSTTGALTVAGGVGVSKNLQVGVNIGVGGSLSSWTTSNTNCIEIKSGSNLNGALYSISGSTGITTNSYWNGTNWIIHLAGVSTRYWQDNGFHYWGNSVYGAGGSTITSYTTLMSVGSNATMGGPGTPLFTCNVPASLKNTTDATYSGDTGASLSVLGGAAIAKSLYVGGTVSLSTPLDVICGGTAINFLQVGDILYASGNLAYSRLAVGSTGQVLTVSGGLPTWAAAPSPTTGTTLSLTGTTDATSTTTGTFKVAGGVGIAKTLYLGNNMLIGSGSLSSWTTSNTNCIEFKVGSNLNGALYSISGSTGMTTNSYWNGTNWIIHLAGVSTRYWQDSGYHYWGNSAYGGGGSTISSYTTLMSVGSNATMGGPGTPLFTCNVPASLKNTTDATYSGDTGASLSVLGGAAIAKSLYVGGTVSLSTPLGAVYGGTGINFMQIGDILYASGQYAFSRLAIGSTGLVLTVSGGVPTWASPAVGTSGTTLSLTTTTDATSTTTGTLKVAGGVGISKTLYVGSNALIGGGTLSAWTATNTRVVELQTSGINSTFYSTSYSTGIANNCYYTGTAWVYFTTSQASRYYQDSGSHYWESVISGVQGSSISFTSLMTLDTTKLAVYMTTDSTTTTTGALIVYGGVGISKNLQVGGTVTLTTALAATSGGTGSKTYTTGDILYSSATNTLSKLGIGSNGQVLVVSGGVPAWGSAASPTTGTTFALSGTTDSTSSTTGTLTVAGGVGISKNLQLGGTLNATGNGLLYTLIEPDNNNVPSDAYNIIGNGRVIGLGNVANLPIANTTSTYIPNFFGLAATGYKYNIIFTGWIKGGVSTYYFKVSFVSTSNTLSMWIGNTNVFNNVTSSPAQGSFNFPGYQWYPIRIELRNSSTTSGGVVNLQWTTNSNYTTGLVDIPSSSLWYCYAPDTSSNGGILNLNNRMISLKGDGTSYLQYSGNNLNIGANGMVDGPRLAGNAGGELGYIGGGIFRQVLSWGSNKTILIGGGTLSNWDTSTIGIEVNGTTAGANASFLNWNYRTTITNNSYYDTANARWAYFSTGTATRYYQALSQHVFEYASSGTANAACSFTTIMTMDNTGITTTNVPFTVTGNATITNVLTLSSTSTSSTVLSVAGTLDASSSTTGALTVAGGVGIAKSVNIGGNLTVNSSLYLQGSGTTYGWLHADNTPRVVLEGQNNAKVVLATAGVEQFVVTNDPKIYTNTDMFLNNKWLYLRAITDTNHWLGYNTTFDGPGAFGNSGGVIGTGASGTPSTYTMAWNSNGISIKGSSVNVTAIANGYRTQTYPLEIGANSVNLSTSYYFYTSSGTSGTSGGSGSTNYSMYANGRIAVTGEVDLLSDFRLKKNIESLPLDLCIDFINKTRPVSFEWRSEDSGVKYGYIAQEVHKSGFPEFISPVIDANTEEYTDEDGFTSAAGFRLTMCYDQVIPIVAKVSKHLLEENASLKQQVSGLQDQLSGLQSKFDALLAQLGVQLNM